MDVEVILKIAGIGVLISVICQILKQSGKEEIATLVSLSGLIVVLAMIVDMISGLFESVGHLFYLF